MATDQPQREASRADLVLPGKVQANYDAPIYARTSGYLRRWLVDIGTPVKAGQLLGEIETPEVDQQLRQAQADLATAAGESEDRAGHGRALADLRTTDSVSKQEADEKISQAEAGDAQLQAAAPTCKDCATSRASSASSHRSTASSPRVTPMSAS